MYLSPAIAPVASGLVEPLIDGVRYLAAVRQAIATASAPGDCIFICGWQTDDQVVLPGGSEPLGELLAARAALGVAVRVLVNATPSILNPWRKNRAAGRRLAALGLPVVLDSTGAWLSGSHHQKQVLVRAGGRTVALVAGMDLVAESLDAAPHDALRWRDGGPWGWHDLGLRLSGPAVAQAWSAFARRWAEAGGAALPPWLDDRHPGGGHHQVQVVEARFPWRRPWHLWPGGRPWRSPSPPGVHAALVHALERAERYVYVEDQYLSDHGDEVLGVGVSGALERLPPELSLFPVLARRLSACPTLEVILLGSGLSDPADPWPGPRNRRRSVTLRRLAARLGPAAQRLHVWRRERVTVHSKVVLVDDAFAAVGSANFNLRSMAGIDDELQVIWTARDGGVARLRQALWSEHTGTSERDLDAALASWRPSARLAAVQPL